MRVRLTWRWAKPKNRVLAQFQSNSLITRGLPWRASIALKLTFARVTGGCVSGALPRRRYGDPRLPSRYPACCSPVAGPWPTCESRKGDFPMFARVFVRWILPGGWSGGRNCRGATAVWAEGYPRGVSGGAPLPAAGSRSRLPGPDIISLSAVTGLARGEVPQTEGRGAAG